MMERLLDAAVDLVALLSPARVDAIAQRMLKAPSEQQPPDLHGLIATPAARAALDRVIENWKRAGASGQVMAGMLMGASLARRKAQHETEIELVWTGPTTPFVPTRRTEQVLLDLIRSARHELFLVSFVAYDVPSVIGELNAASARGVAVRILLEASYAHGGSLSVDPAATMRALVPSALLFTWDEKADPFIKGRVHAKVAVADSTVAFLTSANLTGYALERNMEAGVVIHGGPIPVSLHSHLHALIETKIISRI